MTLNWLVLAESTTLFATFVLLVIFLAVHRRRPTEFSILWIIGWSVYVTRYIFGILNGLYGPITILNIAYNEAAALSFIILLRAALKTASPVRFRVYGSITFGVISIWIIYSAYAIRDIFWVSLPTFFFFGAAQILTGYYFLRANRVNRHIGGYVAGWSFILWGVHKLDYPFLRPLTWFAPIGYLIGALLTIMVGIGILMLLFEQAEERARGFAAALEEDKKSLQNSAEKISQLNASLEQRVQERTQELRDMQEQLVRQEKLAVLGQLAGSVGHELRNPLGVISNAVYFLKMAQPEANQKIKEYLDIIENATRISEKIVTDLLDFTRVGSIDRELVSVPQLVQQTLERFPVPEYIQLTLDLPADLPQVYVDSQHMLQVFGNLTLNACQSMPPAVGTPKNNKLVIAARAQGDMISVSVQDTGVGISRENMKKLFEPLFTTKPKGIGLGLAVSRKLIEANGGRIEGQSELGQGSIFTVYLPTK
jgi:signal transduction histidine kinase